jgi:single-strand DNA-binding protein
MASFNKVYLMGNLTRDPEIRTTPSGLKIAKLGMAVNRRYRTRGDDEVKEETTFVDIDAFGSQAETLEKYCEKGSPLFVEGRLRLEQWQSAAGENRSKLTVVMENFQFIGGGRDSGGGDSTRESAGRYQAGGSGAPSGGQRTSDDNSFQEDDNVPF